MLVLFVAHLVIENVIVEKMVFNPEPAESKLFTYDFEPFSFECYQELPKKVSQKRPQQKPILNIIKKGNPPKSSIQSLIEKPPPVSPSCLIGKSKVNKSKEAVSKPSKSTYDYVIGNSSF